MREPRLVDTMVGNLNFINPASFKPSFQVFCIDTYMYMQQALLSKVGSIMPMTHLKILVIHFFAVNMVHGYIGVIAF